MKEELRKLFRGRLVWGLILLSVVVNAYLLFMQSGKIQAMDLIDDFCMEYGSGVTAAKMTVLEKLWREADCGDITWEEFEANIEMATEYYESVQSGDMADAYCALERLSGKAAEYVREEFGRLDGAIREAAGRELTWFVPCRMWLALMLGIGHAFPFVRCYVSGFWNPFITFVKLTFGQYMVVSLAYIAVIALCIAMITYALSSSARNYVSAIAFQLPTIVFGFVVAYGFMPGFAEITQNILLLCMIPCIWMLAAAAGIMASFISVKYFERF